MAVQTTTLVESNVTTPDAMAVRPAVTIEGLVKTFRRANGTTVRPIDEIDLTIERGEFLVLLGPSGCGKTTLLRCLAGLEVPEAGAIRIGDRTVLDRTGSRAVMVPPERRELGMIFQSYALWPHLTVAKNVAYPLEAARVPKLQIQERVARVLDLVGVAEVAGQLPGRLSGGQQQRVSLARALVAEPSLILFDEPLSNVDAKVREELRLHLVEMQKRIGFTAVYVTHDQVEAMELADRIAVLREGRIQQLDSPAVIYDHPVSRYVAKFIGTANEITATVLERDHQSLIVTLDGILDPVRIPVGGAGDVSAGGSVHIIWRPERTSIVDHESEEVGISLVGDQVVNRYLGAFGESIIALNDGTEVRVVTQKVSTRAAGSSVRMFVAAEDLRVFAAEDDE